MRCRLGLRPRPRWGSLSAPADPLAAIEGSREGREGTYLKREGREGRGREGKEGRGACPTTFQELPVAATYFRCGG